MKRGYLYIAVTTLLFSSMEVALKLISGQFNPIQLNFSRFVVGGLVLIPFAVRELKKRGLKLDGKALGSFALLGLMGIAVSMSLYQLSVTRIQASVVGVLFSSNPVFVTLFAFLLLHETISKNQIAGLVLDVAGIVLIIQPWHLRLDALGVVYVLLATLLFALYGVCGKRQCARFGGIVVTCFGFLFGAAEMIALAGLTHIPALSAGLTASGADAYLMHVTTTPSVSYIVRSDDFDCGIMISASHNPYTDNGIKLLNSAGEKMEQSVIDEIENYLDGNLEIPFATGANIGRTQDYSAGRNRYIGYLISLSTHSYKGMKVGLDCANGSTWMMAKNIFDALGADTYVIGNEPDGTNINRDCGSTHIENLQKYVRLNRLDVGFAFDGDADRCLAVDENGSVVNGDKILYVCARNMQTEGRFGNSKVVTTVMSNLGLYKALDEAGIGYEKTAVGDKYVAENMRVNGHLIGGEQSGHIIFGKYANTGDGLLTAIKLMQVMLDRKKTLSELAAPVREYPQQLTNVEVDDKDATLNDPAVIAAEQTVTERLGDEGRILVRKSGTEPVLRVMVEAATHALCEENVAFVIDAMQKSGHLIRVR